MMSLCRTGTFLLASLLINCSLTRAQDRPHQTDTTVSDTVVVGGQENAGIGRSDSAYTAVDSSLLNAGADASASVNDSLRKRTVPDSVVQDWKNAAVFTYANDPRYWKEQPRQGDRSPDPWLSRLLSSRAFRYGIYIILGALLIYAIGRIVTENQLGVFYRGAKRSGGGTETGDLPADNEDIDLGLQQSMANKDYRQAVRYSFLRTLRRLDERGLIRAHGQTTNQEYLRQLGGTVQEAPFRFLTGAYEKVWYGEFGLSEETFRRLIGYFTEFDKIISG